MNRPMPGSGAPVTKIRLGEWVMGGLVSLRGRDGRAPLVSGDGKGIDPTISWEEGCPSINRRARFRGC
jgi:hypothetical protein